MSGTLSAAQAKHLLRRMTYRYNKAQIDAYAGMSVSAAVDALFNFDYSTLTLAEPIDPNSGQPWINSGSAPSSAEFALRYYTIGWWLNEALNDPTARHKMAFFLHQSFPVHMDVRPAADLYDYMALLRFHAKGSYKELAQRMTLSNIMMRYLNNDNNNRWNPNENYAREFLELFTIGKGPQIAPQNYTHYQELDVQVGAELLTGWRKGDRSNPAHKDPVTGLTQAYPTLNFHVTGPKTFSSAFPDANGQPTTIATATSEADMFRELQDYVDMIFDQDETARHLCRKIYRFFVGGEISAAVETDIINPLAVIMRNSNYSLEATMKALCKSQHFFGMDDGIADNDIVLAVMRSPLDLALHTLSLFELPIPDPTSNPDAHYNELFRRGVQVAMCEKAGMMPFQPVNVAGYSAYYQAPQFHRTWFNGSSIVARYKLPQMLIEGKPLLTWGSLGTQIEIGNFVANSGWCNNPADSSSLVDDMAFYVFGHNLSADRLTYFEDILLGNLSPINWQFEWQASQGAPGSGAAAALEKLFKAMLYSQEYQLM